MSTILLPSNRFNFFTFDTQFVRDNLLLMTDRRRFGPTRTEPFDKDDAAANERRVRAMSLEELKRGEVIPREDEEDERH